MNINVSEKVTCSLFCGSYSNSSPMAYVQYLPDAPICLLGGHLYSSMSHPSAVLAQSCLSAT